MNDFIKKKWGEETTLKQRKKTLSLSLSCARYSMFPPVSFDKPASSSPVRHFIHSFVVSCALAPFAVVAVVVAVTGNAIKILLLSHSRIFYYSYQENMNVPPDDHRLLFSLQMSRAMLRAEFVAVLRAVM